MVEASAARLASPSGYRGGFYNRCMHWRTFHHPQNAAGPLTRWVLAAWLCVLLTSVAAPFARATPPAGWEALCSATGSTHWVPSPASDEASALPHGLDCALCLPLLAPPPARQQSLSWGGAILTAPQWAPAVSRVFVRLLPPVRAPPFETLKTIAASA